MRSVQVSKPKGPLEMVEKDIPETGSRQVRIKIQACDICHGDSITKEGFFPGIEYEVTGIYFVICDWLPDEACGVSICGSLRPVFLS